MSRRQGHTGNAALQDEIVRARASLLGGRGPDASPAEVAAQTRDRGSLGGQPAAVELERVATQTRRARVGLTPGRKDNVLRQALRMFGVLVACAAGAAILRVLVRHLLGPRRQQPDH